MRCFWRGRNDASKPVSVTGVVVEFRAVNPHAVLIVDGTAPDGRSGDGRSKDSRPAYS
jgi:hypothetical protein